MVGSMFAAISGLKAHQTKMDVIGNNIANVNTWGYKAQSANFVDAAYRSMMAGSAGNADAGRGGVNPSQVGYGANVGSISVDYTPGNWNYTGWGADCMIDGTGFFIVTNNAKNTINDKVALTGQSGVSLTRVVTVYADSEGNLTDSAGNYLMGYPAADDGTVAANATLEVLKVKGAAAGKPYETYSSFSIGTDGSISGVVASPGNGRNVKAGDVVVLGKIGVASVQNPGGLEKGQGSLYGIGGNAGTVAHVQANVATGDIMGGYLEMSNTNLSTEMANMITTQRGYQANTKIITVTDQMLEELVNMKR